MHTPVPFLPFRILVRLTSPLYCSNSLSFLGLFTFDQLCHRWFLVSDKASPMIWYITILGQQAVSTHKFGENLPGFSKKHSQQTLTYTVFWGHVQLPFPAWHHIRISTRPPANANLCHAKPPKFPALRSHKIVTPCPISEIFHCWHWNDNGYE